MDFNEYQFMIANGIRKEIDYLNHLKGIEMDITIDPKTKEIHVYSKTITREKIKSIAENYRNLGDYEIFIHNPKQQENIMDSYAGNVNIENLGNVRVSKL